MSSFLHTVATDLLARYGERISGLTLVFPNRRAHLFFSKSLSQIIAKPLWQPVYKSIEELVKGASPLRVADTFTLLVELYAIYGAERKTDEPFDRFYYWGETLLHDFDQLDKYHVNAAALFTNLRHAKEMEGDFTFLTPEQVAHIQRFWNTFSVEKENRLQQDFVAVWEVLLPIYEKFNSRLKDKGIAYEGMVYRTVADSLEACAPGHDGGFSGQYVFIGFNALNECEETLFRFLKNCGRAEFYWDYDAYYVDNKHQEAGLFLRENIKNFPSPIDNCQSSIVNCQLSIISCPSDIAQTKVVPQLVQDMTDTPDERTAVVLADEQLLIPLLHALPAVASQINVTMGYPLRQTAVYSLVELLLQLFGHMRTSTTGEAGYYYQDVQALLAHPYMKQLLYGDTTDYTKDLVIRNNVYVPHSFFASNDALSCLLQPVGDFREVSARLLSLADRLSADAVLAETDPLLRGLLQHVVRQINQLTEALAQSSLDISLKLYSNLLRKIFRDEAIPFTGEPLAGIQVMGLLETRNLDFENIIVLSANEGVLPRVSRAVSFIPYNLRRGFGLPTPEQQEAVWAYYFYRLLQRAKQVKLLYNAKTDGMTTGEPSRYLLQLELESGLPVTKETLSFNVEIPDTQPIVAQKTAESLAAITRISPSALNMYLACPLRFHFRYVAHLKEQEDVAERVDSRQFGNLLHRAMELVYQPWVGQEVTAAMLDQLLKKTETITQLVDKAIACEYYQAQELPPDYAENGDLQIVHGILCQYIRQLLLVDKKHAPFVPEGIELPVEHTFHFIVGGQPRQLVLGGVIDRLHRKGTMWYVVDYKTGHPDNEFESVVALFGDDARKQHPAVLQTLLYSLIVQHEKQQPVTPLLYFLRESHSDEADFAIRDKSEKQPVVDVANYVGSLNEMLEIKFSELFNIEQPFVQTADSKTCEYCAYRTICNR